MRQPVDFLPVRLLPMEWCMPETVMAGFMPLTPQTVVLPGNTKQEIKFYNLLPIRPKMMV